MKKVVKFGGSSLASAKQFKKVGDIIRADKSRRYVVPSAPGKRNKNDTKVTDMLYACYEAASTGASYGKLLSAIKERYEQIIDGLELNLNLDYEFKTIEENFIAKKGSDYAASRGEYLNGIIMSHYLGYEFIDAAEVIFFDENGTFLSEKTNEELSERLAHTERAVIPGFYGSNPDGTIPEVEMTTQGIGGPISPFYRMDAARACLLSGNVMVSVRRPDNDIPVEYLAGIRDGDHAYWKYYDFTGTDADRFICKTWGKNRAAKIEIRLDGPEGELLGVCDLTPMEGEVAYAVHETKIKPVTGKHALVLVFKAVEPADTGDEDLMNLEWFTFSTSHTPR